MKKLLLLLLLFTGISFAQIVNIPDANFKAKLLAASPTNNTAYNMGYITIDINNDNQIQVEEALAVKRLNLIGINILNLTGIEFFINLTHLDCRFNNLTSLNLNNNSSLIDLRCISNNLTNLNIDNINTLSYLDCSENDFTTLNVSSNFALTYLNCSLNSLSNLNIDNNIALKTLKCDQNQLLSLNLNNNTLLKTLSLAQNQLTSLDVINNIELENLGCSYNQISNLIVSNNTALTYFSCPGNLITNLNVTNNILLTVLSCGQNQLTSLDLTNNTSLFNLSCFDNQLSSIDLSTLINLQSLNCSNNILTFLDCSTNTHLTSLAFFQNFSLQTLLLKNGSDESLQTNTTSWIENWLPLNSPNLQYVCVDDFQMSNILQNVAPNVVVNTYCSFTPGGNYNTINGTATFDADSNGCDTSDALIPNIKFNLTDGTNEGATFTNTSGNYKFYTDAGNFVITPNIENPTFFNFSPPSATINFSDNNNNITTQNFCIAPNGVHPDLEVVLTPITPARPGFDATYKLVYKNKGNQTQSGTVNLAFNDEIIDFSSANPVVDSQATNTLTWNYSNLLPFESRSIYIVLNINSPLETPPVLINDILNFIGTINPLSGDDLPEDNTFVYNQTVVGSFDPNDITCLEGETVAPSEIGKYLHYAVNFENTGTYYAENIVVKDIIDTTKYDINSLQVLNTSHDSYIRITGNVIEFIFENINLAEAQGNPPVGGHGNVLFKIKSKNDLVTGNSVSKSASIFFDYNAPISTNVEQTTFTSLSNSIFEFDNSVTIYPNPTSSKININSDFNIKSIELYDVQGRVLVTQIGNSKSLDISDKTNGIYFVKITTEKGSKVEKIVKE